MQGVTGNSSTLHYGRHEWAKLLRFSLEEIYELVMAWELLGTQTRRLTYFLRTHSDTVLYSKVETFAEPGGRPGRNVTTQYPRSSGGDKFFAPLQCSTVLIL